MTINEVKKIIKQDEITEEEKKEVLAFLLEDSQNHCECAVQLYHYFYFVYYPKGKQHIDLIHKITKNYIANGDKRYSFLYYMIELEYYYRANALGRCIELVNKMLELEDIDDNFRLSACFHAVNILERLNMLEELRHYEEYIYELCHKDTLKLNERAVGILNLCDTACYRRDRELFYNLKPELDEYKNKDIDQGIVSLINLHDVYFEILLDEVTEVDEICSRLDKVIDAFSIDVHYAEDFATTMLPIFQKLGETLPKDKMMHYVKKISKYAYSNPDKLEFYGYLMDNFYMAFSSDAELMLEYYQALREYYNETQKIKKSEVEAHVESYKERKELLRIQEEYHIDPLTGLDNRNIIKKYYDVILVENTGVVYFDLNDLKLVNDNYGHNHGDQYLSSFASLLKEAFPEYKTIRDGGDEFLVVAKGISYDELVSRVQRFVISTNQVGIKDNIRFSFGTGIYHGKGITLREAIAKADQAMYTSKNNGLLYSIAE